MKLSILYSIHHFSNIKPINVSKNTNDRTNSHRLTIFPKYFGSMANICYRISLKLPNTITQIDRYKLPGGDELGVLEAIDLTITYL